MHVRLFNLLVKPVVHINPLNSLTMLMTSSFSIPKFSLHPSEDPVRWCSINTIELPLDRPLFHQVDIQAGFWNLLASFGPSIVPIASLHYLDLLSSFARRCVPSLTEGLLHEHRLASSVLASSTTRILQAALHRLRLSAAVPSLDPSSFNCTSCAF